jgi:hypothetical protein
MVNASVVGAVPYWQGVKFIFMNLKEKYHGSYTLGPRWRKKASILQYRGG